MKFKQAPELRTSHWLNTDKPQTLKGLKGKVIVIEAFQMLCPGCVSHGLPQAQRVVETFSRDEVAVLGLHTVFEHHNVQGSRDALAAFLHEYRFTFPVAIDAPTADSSIPQTMAAYGLQGTPSLILIDREGCIRKQVFGQVADLELGAEIMALILDEKLASKPSSEGVSEESSCDDIGCKAPQNRSDS